MDWTHGPYALAKTGFIQTQVVFSPRQPLKRSPLEVQLFCGSWSDEQVIEDGRERKRRRSKILQHRQGDLKI